MSSTNDDGRKKREEMQVTPTVIDRVSPFDSTDQRAPAPARETQMSSDPPTAIVRRDSFRDLPAGTIVGENYEIDARLGAGAMGEVYAAHHVRLGKRVAIKVIGQKLSEDAAAIERFAMEARQIHEGRAEERSIYGEATPLEVKALVADGVPVAPLPPPAPRKADLN